MDVVYFDGEGSPEFNAFTTRFGAFLFADGPGWCELRKGKFRVLLTMMRYRRGDSP